MTDYKAGGRPQAGLQAEGRGKRQEGAGRILPDQEFSLGRTSHLAPRTGMCPTCWGAEGREVALCQLSLRHEDPPGDQDTRPRVPFLDPTTQVDFLQTVISF